MTEMVVPTHDVLKTVAAQLANAQKWQDRFEQADALLKQQAEAFFRQRRSRKGKLRLSQSIRAKSLAAKFAHMSANFQCALAHLEAVSALLDSVTGQDRVAIDMDETANITPP
jgi:septal ring factor EnvC (AmiA/AmiB activator)